MRMDIKEMMRKDQLSRKVEMPKGHESRFKERLQKEFPKKDKGSYSRMAIAASFILGIGAIWVFYQHSEVFEDQVVEAENNGDPGIEIRSLGELSPDLKKIEDYYLATINLEISQLPISDENDEIVKQFMSELKELNADYITLNEELNQYGPNDQTITAMIQNLQLRLDLLRKLKEKLNQLTLSKNETV